METSYLYRVASKTSIFGVEDDDDDDDDADIIFDRHIVSYII